MLYLRFVCLSVFSLFVSVCFCFFVFVCFVVYSSILCTLQDFVQTVISEQNAELTTAHKTCADYTPPRMCFTGNWGHVTQAGSDLTTWQTGYEVEDLRCIGVKSTELPEGFKHHPTLNRAHIVKRTKMMESGFLSCLLLRAL